MRGRTSVIPVAGGSDRADRRPGARLGRDRHDAADGVEPVAHVHQSGARAVGERACLVEPRAVVADVEAPAPPSSSRAARSPARPRSAWPRSAPPPCSRSRARPPAGAEAVRVLATTVTGIETRRPRPIAARRRARAPPAAAGRSRDSVTTGSRWRAGPRRPARPAPGWRAAVTGRRRPGRAAGSPPGPPGAAGRRRGCRAPAGCVPRPGPRSPGRERSRAPGCGPGGPGDDPPARPQPHQPQHQTGLGGQSREQPLLHRRQRHAGPFLEPEQRPAASSP